MPKNKVQFQKGVSLRAFLDSYGSESQCEHALLQIRWPHGLDCPACGSASFCRLRSHRLLQCNRCKRQVSLLAGTIFQSTKLPLTTWFLAIYLLAQAKNGISALELGRLLGVNNNTAWLLKHKLLQAMRERDLGRKLRGTVQIDDAYMGGKKRGGKRGRGSENKTPLVTAVQVTDDTQQPVVLRLSLVAGFRKAELERWAREHLEPGTAVHSDGLACFSGVEAAGCQHEAIVTGGGPGSCETSGLVWVNTTLGNVKRSMDGSYHAVRPKYLARYLAEFQYRFNRRYDLAALAERLLPAAAARCRCPTRCWPPSPSAASRAAALAGASARPGSVLSIRRAQAHLSGQDPGFPTRRPSANGTSSAGSAHHEAIPVLELLDAIRIADTPDTANGPSLVFRPEDARG